MSNFEKAYEFVLKCEGGYSFQPDDKGGETFRGISRVSHPEWTGWNRVDDLKKMEGFPGNAETDHLLSAQVSAFYRVSFWNELHCDELPEKLAIALFDFGVNSGTRTAVRVLQVSLGLEPDGIIGSKTVSAAYASGEGVLVDFLARRAKLLHDIMVDDETQSKWALGWFRRLFRLANLVLEG